MAAPGLDRPDAPLPLGGGFKLRPWRRDDAGALVAALDGDTEVSRWITVIPQPYRADDAEAFLAATIRDWDAGRGGAFAIVDDRDAPVGSIGLDVTGYDAPCIGYWVAEAARGRGLATRAARAVAQLAFDVVGADRVILYAEAENAASRAVARRAGFGERGLAQLGDGITRILYELRGGQPVRRVAE